MRNLMQILPGRLSAASLVLFCLLSGPVAVPLSRAEEAAENEGKPQADSAKAQEKTTSPKKTEYDKLPPAQLLQRADAGDLKAQFELGSRLNYGRGMPRNIKEALRWLRRAAQNGQQDAQRLLAVKFYNGYDVPVDHAEALRWTAQLAEAGDVPAQLSLANMYASGEGSARNLVRAYMWYDIASAAASADSGTEDVQSGVEKAARTAAEQRDKIARLLLPEQEVEAQQLSSDWWMKKQGAGAMQKKSVDGSGQTSKPSPN